MSAADLYGHDAVYVSPPVRLFDDATERRLSVYVPVSVEAGLDVGWWPWLAPDPNPMPHIVISDLLDRVLAYWDEARLRFWVALDVLRRGPDEVLR